MTNEEARRWLDKEWQQVLAEEDQPPDPEIDQFVNSSIVSIRYACMTQLLGKIADPSRHILSIQASDTRVGSWDARSFAKHVIVPWVADNHAVLGTSTEPYVSKPLRRSALGDVSNVRNKAAWEAFILFLQTLDQKNPGRLRQTFKRCLHSLARKLKKQTFDYQIPHRISLRQVTLLLATFLEEPSKGLRPLAVSAALLRVFGEACSIFAETQAQGINEADSASGRPGDIVCYDADKKPALVVEVKDRDLTLLDLQDSVSKVMRSEGISRLLFAVPRLHEQQRTEIEKRIEKEWASGLNVYHIDIQVLANTAFTLLDETWRIKFLREVGKELDTRGDHSHREKWRQILLKVKA